MAAWGGLTYASVESGTVHGFDEESIRNLVAALDVGSAVALASLAAYAYYQARQHQDWVDVVLVDEASKTLDTIDKALQREDLTRGEVGGILRSYHGPGSFQVVYLNSDAYRAQLRAAKDGGSRCIKIKLSADDALGALISADATQGTESQGEIKGEIKGEGHFEGCESVFLNLSNHPSATWSSAQRDAAGALAPESALLDYPFPHVDPSHALDAVSALSESTWAALTSTLNAAGQRPVAAMVAGEPVLCLGLVQRLQSSGVPCYCATTRRETEVSDEGVKTSQFHFVRFRRWPSTTSLTL